MLLINCKFKVSLTRKRNFVHSNLNGASTFTRSDARLYVPIITLSTKDNVKLPKLLSKGFKRPLYWNAYKVVPEKSDDANTFIRESTDSSCQGINRFFVLAYEGGPNRVTVDSYRRYFLPRVEIKNYNIEIDKRNLYDQSVNNQETNDQIKQYDQLRKVSTGQGDDYTTGCLLDFAYFKKKYRLISADLSKQKALDVHSRAIQQIIFTGKVNAAAVICYIYGK